jgi:hypothetical protein
VSGGWLGVKTRWRSGLPGQRRHASSDRGSDTTLKHSGQNGDEAGEASDRAVGAAREARRRSALDTGVVVARLRHRIQRLNTRAACICTTPPTAANQGATHFFQFQITPKSVTRAGKIVRQGGKSGKICGGRKSNLEHFS